MHMSLGCTTKSQPTAYVVRRCHRQQNKRKAKKEFVLPEKRILDFSDGFVCIDLQFSGIGEGHPDSHLHWRRSSSPNHHRNRGSSPSSHEKRKKHREALLPDKRKVSDGMQLCRRLLPLPVAERRKEILLL
ncbi:hypothetical protein MRB53_020258 [Persea americana]|uniref:Uncharacterized protein n=1 Tax=Persea americana TaxID=3435 RepID=A0ACC2L0A2_PERAE|nr:hypothetical protein MRB53_020258 [Persea americana]